ncbi:MAG: CBS and ACT domain-containing protein [Bacillota bacterium]|nr:CBS and ACT domain-containing protein [Bacillota bacterium]
MFVRDYMSVDPITISPDESVGDALEKLKEHAIRRLPVLSKGKIVGLVTNQDLLKASPSPATSLSIHEINYLFPKIKIRDVMTRDVITINPDAAIEEAAVTMRENKIGTLVVEKNGKLVGLITESDIFKAFIDILGFDCPGVRVAVAVDDQTGELGKITSLIGSLNINIYSLVIGHTRDGRVVITMRLKTDQSLELTTELEKKGYEIIS